MESFWKWLRRIMAGFLIPIIGLTALTITAGAFVKSNLARETLPPGKQVDVGGFNMHINCTGDGSPIVGLAVDLDNFSIFWFQVQP